MVWILVRDHLAESQTTRYIYIYLVVCGRVTKRDLKWHIRKERNVHKFSLFTEIISGFT